MKNLFEVNFTLFTYIAGMQNMCNDEEEFHEIIQISYKSEKELKSKLNKYLKKKYVQDIADDFHGDSYQQITELTYRKVNSI